MPEISLMNGFFLTFAVSSILLIAALAFLPSKQSNPQPVRVRRNHARQPNRR